MICVYGSVSLLCVVCGVWSLISYLLNEVSLLEYNDVLSIVIGHNNGVIWFNNSRLILRPTLNFRRLRGSLIRIFLTQNRYSILGVIASSSLCLLRNVIII